MNPRLQEHHGKPSTESSPRAEPVPPPVADEFYQVIFDQAADGIFVSDAQGRYLAVNQQGCQMVGYTHEELLRLSVYDLLPAAELTRQPLRLAELRARHSVLMERTICRKDGTFFPIEVRAQMLSDGRVVAFLRDITARKQAEETQHVNDQNMALAQRHAHFGSWELLFNDEFELVSPYIWSDECYRIFGFDPGSGAMTTERFFSRIHPEDRAEVLQKARQNLKAGKEATYEYRLALPDGAIRHIQQHSSYIRNQQTGRTQRIISTVHDVTDYKAIEATLHYQANLLQHVHDAIIATNLDFHITSWNHGAETLFGWRADEVMGRRLRDLLRVQYVHAPPDVVVAHLHTQGHWRGETIQYHKDGTPRYIMSSVSLLKDADGNIVGTVGVSRNITEQKHAEDALRQSEERFIKIFRASPAALGILRQADTCLVDVNMSFERLFGYAHAAIVGQRFTDLNICTTPIERTIFAQKLRAQGWIRDFEATAATQDGKILNILLSAEIVELAGEAHILVIIFDITKRKQAEERLTLALEAAQMGVWEWTAQTDEFSWSPECSTILGIDYAMTPTIDFVKFLHPDDLVNVINTFDNEILHQTGYTIDYRIIRPSGEVRWVSQLGRAIRDSGGNIVRVLGTVQDVTERKRVEMLQAKLEEQLRQAQKMETIGRLAGGIAHDFNNLLTVIQGYCDLMQMQIPNNNSLYNKLEQIRKAGQRATALTGQLLAFGRKQMLAPSILDLNSLVLNLQSMLERLIGEDISLSTNLHPALWSVIVDASQIEQVIMNLVVNARDAMPTGGTLSIETSNVMLDPLALRNSYANPQVSVTAGPYVMLAVTDTGCGIDAQIRAQIFEPFFTTKEQGKGTGLGLATVYGIVKQSGGDIFVYSEPGHGSTFKIYLPASKVSINPQVTVPIPAPASVGSETILLVEDEEMVRELVKAALQAKGYTILEARHASEALALFTQHLNTIDLLVTDVVMPQISGRELAEHLITLRPGLKVLFTSGYTDDAVVRHGLLTAEVEFLPKPFSTHTLATKVREVLDKDDRPL